MTTDIYQAWLSDRGINSPVTQPFVLLGSDIVAHSQTLVVASAAAQDLGTQPAVIRLAQALKAIVPHFVSWVVVDQDYDAPSRAVLRGLLPTLTNIVMLVEQSGDVTPKMPEAETEASYPIEDHIIASRPLKIIFGPTMSTMANDLAVKKRFWLQVQAWLLPAQRT